MALRRSAGRGMGAAFAGMTLTLMAALTAGPLSPSRAAVTMAPINELSLKTEIAKRRGKLTLVNVWSKTCAPCVASYPGLVKLARRYAPSGLSVISINVIDDAKTRATWSIPFLKKLNPPFAAFYEASRDQEVFIRALDPKWQGSLPADFLFDAAGRRVKSFTGGIDEKRLEAAVKAQLAQLPKRAVKPGVKRVTR